MKKFCGISEKNLTIETINLKFNTVLQDEVLSKQAIREDLYCKNIGQGNQNKELKAVNSNSNKELLLINKGGLKPFISPSKQWKGSETHMKNISSENEQKKAISLKKSENIYDYVNDADFIRSGLNNRQYRILMRLSLFSRKEEDRKAVTVNSYLATHFNCSKRTIQRDLKKLQESNFITIDYGDLVTFNSHKIQAREILINDDKIKRKSVSRGCQNVTPHDKMSHNNNIINNINKDVEVKSPLPKKALCEKKEKSKTPIVQGYIFRTFKKECIRLDIAISDLVLIEEAHKFFAYWQEKSFLDSTGKKIHIRSKIASWIHHDRGIFSGKLTEKTKLLNEKLEQVKEKQVQQQEKAYAESLEGQIDTLTMQIQGDLVKKYEHLGFVESRKKALQEANKIATEIVMSQTKNINKMNKNVDFKEDFTQNKNQVLFNLKSDTNLNLFTGSVV